MPQVTAFVDTVAVGLREIEVPDADFGNGCNAGASNSSGIGINIGGGEVIGTPEQYTLLDQFENARAAQISQCIGGPGYSAAGTSDGQEGTLPDAVIRAGNPSAAGDGLVTATGNASLLTLLAGWTSV